MASRVLDLDSLVGLELGHYQILEKVGAGGMGDVYRARDEHLDRDVAIKILPRGTLIDSIARKYFHKEALILSQLDHPCIATIHDFDTQFGTDYLVMEYIPGMTLSAKLRAGPIAEKEVIALGTQLAEGLNAAHDRGVIHRDLKPGNLQITKDGRLKILDFGLAKLRSALTPTAITESLSDARSIVGTVPYMAPEQLLGGEVDPRTDIHAAGTVLYEMATGQHPFAEKERGQTITAILHRTPRSPRELNSRVSVELARIICKCLEKDPEDRYQSARELAVDLRRLQTGRLIAVHAVAPSVKSNVAKSKLPLAITVSIVVVLIIFNISHWRSMPRSSQPTHIQSLAVLPLANLSGDSGQDYFAEGMTEELTSELAKIHRLEVRSRNSAMRFKGSKQSSPQIAQELRVDGLVAGSAERGGGRVHVTVQLIDAAHDAILWVRTYDREEEDVLRLHSAVARDIADQIQIELTPQETQRLAETGAVVPAAHEAYLRGRYHWNIMTEQELKKAREYFQQAASLNPNYAPAYAGLADYYTVTTEAQPNVASERAKTYARQALLLDEALAEAHLSLAKAQYNEWDWGGAEREVQRAIELNSSYSEAHRFYAIFLSALGREQKARTEIRDAQQLDPVSVFITTSAGWVEYFARNYDGAIRECKKALELDPINVNAHDCLGSAYLGKGMNQDAISECRTATTLSKGDSDRALCLGLAYAAAGQTAKARRVLQRLYRASRTKYVPPSFFALLHAAVGEKKQAFGWLDKSYDVRDPHLVWINVSPAADPLRASPQWQDFVRRIGMPS